MRFCGEIQYGDESTGWVHSDICFNCGPRAEDEELGPEVRKILHEALDEWLDKSKGSGAFWVGDQNYMLNLFKEEN